MRYARVACAAVAMLVAFVGASAADSEVSEESASVKFRQTLPGSAAKSLVAVVVNYPPGARSRPHRHAPSAFIYAYVLSGEIRSQVDDEPVKIYRAGESWVEKPGAHHLVSENASATTPAKLLAIFITSDGKTLTVPDPKPTLQEGKPQ